MRVAYLTLVLALGAWAQARPSYLHNRHSTNLVWQTRATTFTGVDTTKTGTVIHWDFGDGTSQDINDPVKVYPDTSLKTVYMVAADGWGGLTVLNMNTRSLRGPIPSLARATALVYFYVNNNQLTGAIPSLTANTALVDFIAYVNQLTGSIPSLTTNTALAFFYVNNNQLTGAIPSLTANTALVYFNVGDNQLTGSIPSLAANTALVTFHTYNNQLTSYAGGLGTRVLTTFNAWFNALTGVAVNAILADLVVAQAGGNPVCTVNLSGGTNAAPTGQGLTDKATLIAAGWTVTTN